MGRVLISLFPHCDVVFAVREYDIVRLVVDLERAVRGNTGNFHITRTPALFVGLDNLRGALRHHDDFPGPRLLATQSGRLFALEDDESFPFGDIARRTHEARAVFRRRVDTHELQLVI